MCGYRPVKYLNLQRLKIRNLLRLNFSGTESLPQKMQYEEHQIKQKSEGIVNRASQEGNQANNLEHTDNIHISRPIEDPKADMEDDGVK